jgi:NitT/TauT family transport system substrate-binding protein
MHIMQSRRDLLASLSAAGAASVLSARASLADEGPPETTTMRLLKDPSCGAPISVAEEFVRAEGFTHIRYVEIDPESTDTQMLMNGRMDIGVAFAPDVVRELDAGTPVTVLAGIHPGCFELFAHEPLTNIKELTGRSVAVAPFHYGPRLLLSVMLAYVGLDPARDINFVKSANPLEIFVDGRADAFIGSPPETQELRARKVGRVILDTATDLPWSQYFCCVLVSTREYVRNHPVATKRVLRAILKSTEFCASEPRQAAQRLVKGGFGARYDQALQMLSELPYGRWREYDPEDTLRFYALRLHDLGLIKSSPNVLIAEGTDWRFLNEIKRELKA